VTRHIGGPSLTCRATSAGGHAARLPRCPPRSGRHPASHDQPGESWLDRSQANGRASVVQAMVSLDVGRAMTGLLHAREDGQPSGSAGWKAMMEGLLSLAGWNWLPPRPVGHCGVLRSARNARSRVAPTQLVAARGHPQHAGVSTRPRASRVAPSSAERRADRRARRYGRGRRRDPRGPALPGRCRQVIPHAKVSELITATVELSSEAIQHTVA
jgi:hypothetical protein